MNRFLHRILYHGAFAVGLAATAWIAAGYVSGHGVALAMTLLIAAFYLAGAAELHRFRQATASLNAALAALPAEPLPALGPWLARLHPSLRDAVRLRVEGERVALPAPAMTPYLTGLLVLLGMLGTFLGMVVTLNGTGAALQSATDVQAVRAALAAPVQGLGLAFGTSVAGVAASAMLGLMSSWSRRERLQAGQALDAQIAGSLRVFSQAHQRETSLQLLQRQAEVMPALVSRLEAMMTALERQGETLGERLAAGQERFHRETEARYARLADSVDRSLKDSLAEGARSAGAAIAPAVQMTMAGIARETSALHTALNDAVQRQLDGLSARMQASADTLARQWQAALDDQRHSGQAVAEDLRQAMERFSTHFEQRAVAWSDETRRSHAELQATLSARDEQRLGAWTAQLHTLAESLRGEWQQAGAQTLAQQQQICQTLEHTATEMRTQAQAHAAQTIAEVTRLMDTAAEAPRAAAEVIAALRQQLAEGLQRDNAVIEERGRLMETLATMLDAVNHASGEQRAAIDSLVGASAELLQRVGAQFEAQVQAQSARAAESAAQVAAGAIEVASLGEAFGTAVQQFSQSNDKLAAQLQRIEGALSQSMARSDEQLAYYVAQAREVIDLSLASQKQIVEDLQRLSAKAPALAAEA